ncbi:heptaprenyl diphosphate synthase [Terribacillus halophilus]|uniref:Heptaprenyl diphosphate synthase component 2 n=1 Tax=Terribacillus halophilus TaxID=361279 RepID=A0A1G6V1N9_9BACI|nr:heptaprenyl diphosphate synthase component II [Terribacillus halophilus]SDD47442.1 heptaprenyl diphosphate synthase [Terribacillus halophilus]
MKLPMIYSYLKKDLDKIEDAMTNTIRAEHPVLEDASVQLLRAGGKRIRPVFVLLSGKFGTYELPRIQTVAVALELIHMASLVHDDVIDDAELRRGKPTVKAKWDNKVAMYAGDYIFARSLEYLSKLEEPRAHQILAHTIVELCIGEVEQIRDKYRIEQHLKDYLRRIRRKTAILIAASARLGAIASGAPLGYESALYRYGYYVGMSYQIIDDVLDFTASETDLGKPAGGDLLQGNMTLPALLACEDRFFKERLTQVFRDPEAIDRETLEPFIQHIKTSDAIERSLAISDRYLEKAYRELDKLPPTRDRNTLKQIARHIGKRSS